MTDEQKYAELNCMWEKATDMNNADRLADVKMVHQEMLGRIMNQI